MSTQEEIAELLGRGIAAARAGRVAEARQALLRVVECDERNEQAWLWLSGVVESPEDRRLCLENVLAINPTHAAARAGLRHLQQADAQPGPEPTFQAPPPASQPTPAVSQPEPQAPASGGEHCPHCSSPLPPHGTNCPACGGPLLIACPSCGEYAAVEQHNCARCGYALGDYRQGAGYYLPLAEAAMARGRRDAALQAVVYAEASAGTDPDSLEAAATLYEKLGRPDQALAACERALAAAPKNPALYARLGAIHRARGRTEAARSAMEQAAALSTDPAVRLELARLYLADERTIPDAVKVLEQALKAQPMNAQIHILLGDARLKQHDKERAQRHYQDAARLAAADSSVGLEARTRLAEVLTTHPVEIWPERPEGGRARGRVRERPGCLTVYAFWTGLSGAAMILGGLALVLLGSSLLNQYARYADLPEIPSGGQAVQIIAWIAGGVSVGLGLFYLVLAYGLWALKNWARIVVLVLQVLGLLGSLCQTVGGLTRMRDMAAAAGMQQLPIILLVSPLIGLVISGYVIFWFWANRDLFH